MMGTYLHFGRKNLHTNLARFSILLLACSARAFASDTIFTGDNQVFSQVVDGGSWKTTITLLNLGNNTATFALNFFGDDGKVLAFDTNLGSNNAFAGTIPPHGSVILSTNGTKQTLSQGWGLLTPGSDSVVSGSALFRARSTGQPDLEAAVPGDSSFDSRLTFPFDHQTTGTGIALVDQFSFTPITISILIRDENGSQLVLDSFTMQAMTHLAITLNVRYPQTLGHRGSVEVSTTGLGVNVLGLPYSGATFTSLVPVSSFP